MAYRMVIKHRSLSFNRTGSMEQPQPHFPLSKLSLASLSLLNSVAFTASWRSDCRSERCAASNSARGRAEYRHRPSRACTLPKSSASPPVAARGEAGHAAVVASIGFVAGRLLMASGFVAVATGAEHCHQMHCYSSCCLLQPVYFQKQPTAAIKQMQATARAWDSTRSTKRTDSSWNLASASTARMRQPTAELDLAGCSSGCCCRHSHASHCSPKRQTGTGPRCPSYAGVCRSRENY